MKYYKEEIALDQINASIKLFFEWINNISIKTLTHATKNMLEDIDKNNWTNFRMECSFNTKITTKEKNAFFDKINNFPNFCKHSDRKKTKEKFIETKLKLIESNEIEIFFCINLYRELYKDKEHKLFDLYYGYLFATRRFDYLFVWMKYKEPQKYEDYRQNQKELWLTKENKNLKKEFYNIMIDLWIQND